MPKSTVIEIPQDEQAQMLAALRRARYGYLLALHILLLCAAGRNPTEIAAVLFCSRSSVYRTVRAYQEGTLGLEHDDQGRLLPPVRTTVLGPSHALEWCHAGPDLADHTGPHGLGRDDAPLGARGRLGVEAGQAGGQRRRSPAGRSPGPHPVCLRTPQTG